MFLSVSFQNRPVHTMSGRMYAYALRNCSIPYFHAIFRFMSTYYFALIFSFTYTRCIDNMPSLHKTFYTRLILCIYFFVWEALQMTKTWSCERLKRQSRYRKYGKGCGLSIKNSHHGTVSPELWFPQHRTGKCSEQWQSAE